MLLGAGTAGHQLTTDDSLAAKLEPEPCHFSKVQALPCGYSTGTREAVKQQNAEFGRRRQKKAQRHGSTLPIHCGSRCAVFCVVATRGEGYVDGSCGGCLPNTRRIPAVTRRAMRMQSGIATFRLSNFFCSRAQPSCASTDCSLTKAVRVRSHATSSALRT
jgi:hypothetical protein